MELSFERFEDGKWYVVFPEYDGPQEDLEMVDGADKMLDALTEDGMYVTLDVYLEEPSSNEKEGLYKVQSNKPESEIIDLNNKVFRNIFGKYPNKIYCNITDIEIKDFLF